MPILIIPVLCLEYGLGAVAAPFVARLRSYFDPLYLTTRHCDLSKETSSVPIHDGVIDRLFPPATASVIDQVASTTSVSYTHLDVYKRQH